MTGFGASVNDIAKYWAAQGKPKVTNRSVNVRVDKKTDTETDDDSDDVDQKRPPKDVKRPLKS